MDFTAHADAQLAMYWDEQDGALSWLVALETELKRRGYSTRDDDGKPTMVVAIARKGKAGNHRR